MISQSINIKRATKHKQIFFRELQCVRGMCGCVLKLCLFVVCVCGGGVGCVWVYVSGGGGMYMMYMSLVGRGVAKLFENKGEARVVGGCV